MTYHCELLRTVLSVWWALDKRLLNTLTGILANSELEAGAFHQVVSRLSIALFLLPPALPLLSTSPSVERGLSPSSSCSLRS